MKIFEKLTLTHLIYIVILIIAIIFRMVNLGEVSLTNEEARSALCALDTNRQGCGDISTLYTFFTNTIFTIFGDTNFTARIFPAMIGSLIVLLPYLLKPLVERKTGIVLAVCLALDPILIQTSRTAGGPILGIVFILFTLVFLLKQDWRTALMIAAFGLLCGSSFWIGSISLGLTYGVTWLLTRKQFQEEEFLIGFHKKTKNAKQNKNITLALVLLWIAICTRLLSNPAALFSPFQSLLTIFPSIDGAANGQVLATDVRMVVFLLYSFFTVVFCIVGIFRGKPEQNRRNLFLILWIIFGLVVFLIPQFSFQQAAWICIPLWVFAAESMLAVLEKTITTWKKNYIPILIGLVILVFLFFQILRLHYLLSVGLDLTRNMALLLAPILLCILFFLLYGYGWSMHSAVQVVSTLFLLCAAFSLLQNASHAADISGTYEYELVRDGPYSKNEDILLTEIESYRKEKDIQLENVTVALSLDERTENLEWMLRNYKVDVIDNIVTVPENKYKVYILNTNAQQSFNAHESKNLFLSSNVAWVQKDFSGFLPDQILEWLLYRTVDVQVSSYTVWFKL